jgi:hypothetical protein
MFGVEYLGNKIGGPYFFRERLNGLVYLNFLQNIQPFLLEETDLHRKQNMWIQQDGAPPHFHRDVRRNLDTIHANKWIGRGLINPWLARNPDITPLDNLGNGQRACLSKIYQLRCQLSLVDL